MVLVSFFFQGWADKDTRGAVVDFQPLAREVLGLLTPSVPSEHIRAYLSIYLSICLTILCI